MDETVYKQTLKEVFPTQFEPGSLADRLLLRGREEGKLIGQIQVFQELLGEEVMTLEQFDDWDSIALAKLLMELKQRWRNR